jgi:DNA-binding transcriptional LysR family regulator
MELRHLRYFVAIAEERSFTRAAERLWVAQPGLSTQIRRLEAELGIQLFARHTRGVDLTEAGELFLDRARTTLAAAEAARCTGHDLEVGLVGSVRLGVATGVGWRGAADFLYEFGRDRPAVDLSVVESHGGALLRDLRDGRLDAVIAPDAFGSAELRRVRVGREPWVVLAGRRHRLAGRQSLTAGDLAGERFVVTGHRDGGGYDALVADTLEAMGVTAVLERGGPGPALFAPVAAGDALALTTAPPAAAGEIAALALNPARRVDFALLWGEETPSPALGQLIRHAETGAAPARPALVAVA